MFKSSDNRADSNRIDLRWIPVGRQNCCQTILHHVKMGRHGSRTRKNFRPDKYGEIRTNEFDAVSNVQNHHRFPDITVPDDLELMIGRTLDAGLYRVTGFVIGFAMNSGFQMRLVD